MCPQVEAALEDFHSHMLDTLTVACEADLERLEERLQVRRMGRFRAFRAWLG